MQHMEIQTKGLLSVRSLGCFPLILLLVLSCKEKVSIIGEVRHASRDCEAVFVDYEFKVNPNELSPAVERPDLCAVMADSGELTCFTDANNPKNNDYLARPRSLPHTAPNSSHPDLVCWPGLDPDEADYYAAGGHGGALD